MKFFMPTKVLFGEGLVKENGDIFKSLGKKALIVTGRSSARLSGAYDDVVEVLAQVGVDFILFDEVEENPSLETIVRGSRLGLEAGVDFLIGIGGGSPMDGAKAMSLLIANPGIEAKRIFSPEPLAQLPVLAIPTTSGTGSEVTQYSIITLEDEKTKKNIAQGVFPVYALADYSYTRELPTRVTINTAVDAFTHLVEGYLNTNADDLSDIYGERGFILFRELFKKLLDEDFQGDFREKMMLASLLAGVQIAQNGTSIPHGMGYSLTYFKGLAHGPSCGLLTLAFLKVFKNKGKVNRMLELLGLENLEELEDILNRLLPFKVDIEASELEDYAREFSKNKDKLKNFPEDISYEEILGIYLTSLV